MHEEMTDQEFGHQVLLGAVVGIVATFVVMVTGLLIFTGIGRAAPAMAWAAIVGGGFFGGTVTISLAMARAEKAEKAEREARRARRSADPPRAA